jgi:hypothetical protein
LKHADRQRNKRKKLNNTLTQKEPTVFALFWLMHWKKNLIISFAWPVLRPSFDLIYFKEGIFL